MGSSGCHHQEPQRDLEPITLKCEQCGEEREIFSDEVKKKFADTSNKSWINGRNAVFIGVDKLPEEDLEEITKYADKYAEEFNAENQGVSLEISFSFLQILNSRLDLLTKNGIIGLVLVILVLSMFLNVRLSLWVSWGIPFSFLAMFIYTI